MPAIFQSVNLKSVNVKNPKTWIAAVAGLYIAVFVVTALFRLGYPYQLTWMEGAIVDHARQLLAGKPLYGTPSMDFTPYIYSPFYYYISALFMKITGIAGPLVPRLLSFVGSLLVLFMAWRLVKKDTGSNFHALLAPAFFAGTYPFVRCYLDMARVDALFLFFLFWGFYVLKTSDRPHAPYLSAFAFFMAIYTKQQALLVIIPTVLALAMTDFRKSVKFSLTFGTLCLAAFAYFQWMSDGWFLFYIYRLPGAHGITPALVPLIFKDLLFNVPIMVLAAAYWLFKAFRRHGGNDLLYGGFFIGTFIASWVSRAHRGGAENVLLPLFISLSVLAALGTWHISRNPNQNSTQRAGRGRAQMVVLLLVMVQWALFVYNPLDYIPKKEHHRVNEALISLIRGFDGPVLIPATGYLPHLAGKKTHAHRTAILDVTHRPKTGAFGEIKAAIEKVYCNAFKNKRFSAVIFRKHMFCREELEKYYEPKGVFEGETSLCVHGYEIKKLNIYVPRKQD